MLTLSLLILSAAVLDVYGHGWLRDPPGRASLYRFTEDDPFIAPFASQIQQNFNDIGLICSEEKNEKACGVCGDTPTQTTKEYEAGGIFALGIITRYYEVEQLISVQATIEIPHGGYFEFRLCPWNNTETPITHECLDRYLLRLEDGSTKWDEPTDTGFGTHTIRVQLPEGVSCSQCVLQWKYFINRPDSDFESAFYGCSDIAIGIDPPRDLTTTTQTTTTTTTTVKTTTTTRRPRIRRPAPRCRSSDYNGRIKCFECSRYYTCARGQRPNVRSCRPGQACKPETGRCVNRSEVRGC